MRSIGVCVFVIAMASFAMAISPVLMEKKAAAAALESTVVYTELMIGQLATLEQMNTGKWHLYSDLSGEQVHETISRKAFEKQSTQVQNLFKLDQLKRGVRWNDMPVGSDQNDDISDGYLDVDTFLRIFFITKTKRDLLYASHFGCLQHIHSMCPIMFEDSGKKPMEQAIFTNAEVRKLIFDQLRYWWKELVANYKDKERLSWTTGKILHAIQDAYPRGHAARSDTASSCGKVILFQGYTAQEGNDLHKLSDYSPFKLPESEKGNKASLQSRYNCAINDSASLLRFVAACVMAKGKGAACDFDATVVPYLSKHTWAIDDRDLQRRAGGVIAEFASKGLDRDPAFRLDEHWSGLRLYMPQGRKFWKDSKQPICGPRDSILSKTVNRCFLYPVCIPKYAEKPFNRFANSLP